MCNILLHIETSGRYFASATRGSLSSRSRCLSRRKNRENQGSRSILFRVMFIVKTRFTIKLIDVLNLSDEEHSDCDKHPAYNACYSKIQDH